MRVAALIPARDEEGRVEDVLRRLRRAVPGAAILVVDSASRDRTAAVAAAEGAEVIPAEAPGYALAIATGYRALVGRGLDAVIQLDADGQHPPEEAPRLLEALRGADWVIGSRQGTESGGPLDRRVGGALLGGAVWLATGRRLGDVTSGYQALGPRALALFARSFPCCHADANVRVLGLRAGLALRELPVAMAPRRGGQSMHDGLRGARNLAGSLVAVLEESRRQVP